MEFYWIRRMRDKISEIDLFGLYFRIEGADGLTPNGKHAIDGLLQKFGYKDVWDMAKQNGFSSPREMAHNFHFKNVRDYFVADGWGDRLERFDRNVTTLTPLKKR